MIEFDQNLNPVQPPQPSNSFTHPPAPPVTPKQPMMIPQGGRNLGLVAGLVVLVILFATGWFALNYHPSTSSQMEGLTVNADATVYATPDIAKVNVGAMKTGKTVADVESQLSAVSDKITKAILDTGVKEADIKTVDYNIYPDQTYSSTIGTRITGYTGRHSLEVTIRDLNKTDEVLSKVTAAGANEVGQLNFTVENQDDKVTEARKEAMKKAKSKAKQMAEDGNFRLGRLISVNEYNQTPGPLYDTGGIKGLGGSSSPSTQEGSLAIQVNVTLVYQIR